VRNLDVILASASPPADFLRRRDEGYLDLGIPQEWILKNTVGDVCGCLFLNEQKLRAKPQAEADQIRHQLARIETRWIGAHKRDLEQCAERARARGVGGVILLAVGEGRACAVWAAVKAGLVNHLLLDAQCAGDLAAIARQESIH